MITGLWPIFSMHSFQKVTGPKTDEWLVKTIGMLITVSGFNLLRSAFHHQISKDTAFNSIGQAFSIGSVSLFYSLKGRIPKIYLLEAAAEFTLLVLWFNIRKRNKFLTT